jgi:hypothetical protein
LDVRRTYFPLICKLNILICYDRSKFHVNHTNVIYYLQRCVYVSGNRVVVGWKAYWHINLRYICVIALF